MCPQWRSFHNKSLAPIIEKLNAEHAGKRQKLDESEMLTGMLSELETLNLPSHIEGDLHVGGYVHTKGVRESNADFAEMFAKLNPLESIEPGQVVGLFDGPVVSLRTDGAFLTGVVSKDPALCGAWAPDEAGGRSMVPVVLAGWAGQVDVLVRGAVSAGDLLVASGKNDGAAVAAEGGDDTSPVLGIVGRVPTGPPTAGMLHEVRILMGTKGTGRVRPSRPSLPAPPAPPSPPSPPSPTSDNWDLCEPITSEVDETGSSDTSMQEILHAMDGSHPAMAPEIANMLKQMQEQIGREAEQRRVMAAQMAVWEAKFKQSAEDIKKSEEQNWVRAAAPLHAASLAASCRLPRWLLHRLPRHETCCRRLCYRLYLLAAPPK
jgi:hypothetical protein